VFENIVASQINNFISANSNLNDHQSGFRENRSCTSAILRITEDIRQQTDNSYVTFLILLDYSKAFDTVNHEILCSKLKNLYFFSNTAVKLLCSYLKNRLQYVVSSNIRSLFAYLKRGLPQDSVLGPLLFTLYINDLPSVLSTCNVHLYTDDVQMYVSRPLNRISECLDICKMELAKVNDWAKINGLVINPLKSKCLIIFKKKLGNIELFPLMVNETQIEYVETANNLGITFNRTLNWNDHVNNSIHSSIARFIFKMHRSDHVTQFAYKIFNISLADYIKSRTIIFLHKVIYTKEPSYLFEKLQFSRSARTKNII